MQVKTKLPLDFSRKNHNTVSAKRGDALSRFIDITLLHNGVALSLVNHIVKIYAKKPDGTKVFNNVTVTDPANGLVTVELTSQLLAVKGFVECELSIYGQDNSLIATQVFSINVEETIRDDGAIQSSNEFTALTLALDKVNNLEINYAPRLTSVESQLADNTSALMDEFEYMGIWLPSDFPKSKIPFKIFRDLDNLIKHQFDFATLETGTNIYWSEANGADSTNTGLTPASPVKSLSKALEIAATYAPNDVLINAMDTLYTRTYCMHGASPTTAYILKQNITIKATQPECYMGTIEKIGAGGITFSADGTAYKAARTAVSWVLDKKYKDEKGEPVALTKVNSVVECQNTPGSWYADGTNLWIRRKADETIDSDVLVLLNTANLYFALDKYRLAFRGINAFYNWNTTGNSCLKITGTATSKFYSKDCNFSYSGGNGVEAINIGYIYNFNSKAYRNGYDGFNYHESPATANPYGFVLEYMCEVYENGQNPTKTKGINNGSTAHDGITILRIGGKAWENDGPNIADVNSCYTVCIDCISYNSVRPYYENTKAAYYFNSQNGLKTGKVYLINCKGGGIDTYSIGSDGLIEINVHKFVGKNISPETKLKHF